MNDRSWIRRRNWWKIGFFVTLAAFEFTRELLVVSGDPETRIAGFATISSSDGYTAATGRWTRLDGGDRLIPGATMIECIEASGQCSEVTAMVINGFVGTPFIDRFPATFSPKAVTYQNDGTGCASYRVRIDLELQKVFAMRERNDGAANADCATLERRIESTLGDGIQPDQSSLDDHFVPMLRVMSWLAS